MSLLDLPLLLSRVACKIGFRPVHFRNFRHTVSLQFLAFVYAASGLASKCPAFWLKPLPWFDPTLKLTVRIFEGCTATRDITSLCPQGCGLGTLPASAGITLKRVAIPPRRH